MMAGSTTNPKPNIIKYKDKKRVPYRYGVRTSLRLEKLDTRTKVGKTAKLVTDWLWDYVGDFSPIAALLIDRAVFKSIQLVLFESKHLEHPLSDMPKIYLSISNSLRQDLKFLAEFVGESKPPDLQDYVKEVYATGHHKNTKR
jgi:hypothetical protein